MLDFKNLPLKCKVLANQYKLCIKYLILFPPCRINMCRKGDKAGSVFCGKAAEHGHRRRSSGASRVQSCGNATATHLLEERQRYDPSLEGQG